MTDFEAHSVQKRTQNGSAGTSTPPKSGSESGIGSVLAGDGQFSVTVEPVGEVQDLAARWRVLEAQSDRSFFLSWTWISTWLSQVKSPVFLVSVHAPTPRDGPSDIALGLFGTSVERRHGVLPVRQLILHSNGEASLDAITIEYNNLLMARGYEQSVWPSVLSHLKSQTQISWREMIVPGALAAKINALEPAFARSYTRSRSGSWRIDLATLRDNGIRERDSFISTLSKNARGQIRRAFRRYEEFGEVRLEKASSMEDAKSFFAAMGKLNSEKWIACGREPIMDNSAFVNFHQQLIETGFSQGSIEMLCAKAGERHIGWLYNFCDRGRVLFYFSGFPAEQDNQLKPGLVTQVLAIEAHLKGDASVYDFMAGDDRYKQTLGARGPEIITIGFQQSDPLLTLEALARRLKASFRALR